MYISTLQKANVEKRETILKMEITFEEWWRVLKYICSDWGDSSMFKMIYYFFGGPGFSSQHSYGIS